MGRIKFAVLGYPVIAKTKSNEANNELNNLEK